VKKELRGSTRTGKDGSAITRKGLRWTTKVRRWPRGWVYPSTVTTVATV
jgi:hypothetical protein